MDDDERREPEEAFEDFFVQAEPRLRAALTSLYGADMGREATAEAMAWAYEHWDRVFEIEHRVAYLYRVGQSRTRRLRRPRPVTFVGGPTASMPDVDPRLAGALAALPERQRVAVTLVHGHDWSHGDVAALLGISSSTVATHVARAVAQLRAVLEVPADDRH
jgi:DNA-directed RNA polymerase specialized sigma24 family protein